jgi:hypothetical protein
MHSKVYCPISQKSPSARTLKNTFEKFIVRTVDHALRNVLVNEEEKGEGEPQQHPRHNHLNENNEYELIR